jgi:dienelactone hydrolase
MIRLPQGAIPPTTDLREMLRAHIVSRSLACMAGAEARRTAALADGAFTAYQQAIRAAVRGFYETLPAGGDAPPPDVTPVSAFTYPGFRVENVLFETYPGWQVNATVYVPTECTPPFPVVIVPVGHSGKQFESYQLPCQYFARAGFLAICFDPPGQASEKQPGNDHFVDGVRDYLLGQTSSRYFISDAIRCIDYAATRADSDLTRGVAMTGVSGGGTTTTFAALLDDRIAVIGPSCCVTPLADLDIAQCYCGCPETHQLGRYAAGIDEVDLLCAAAPTPCLLMAGEQDGVFHIEDTRRLADTVAGFYAGAEAFERFAFFVDPGVHAYSLTQVREFTRFMNRWLRGEPDRAICELPDDAFGMLSYDELRCAPRTDVNMRTLAMAEATMLAAGWDRSPAAVRRAAAVVAGVTAPAPIPDAEVGPAFQVWSHDWHAVMLRPEPGIELPATLLTARPGRRGAAILHLDDAGRHRLLHRQGPLTAAMRFFQEDGSARHLFTVDLRGWGDTAPAIYPYEMAGWGSLDRYVAYATAALGDPVMAMRIRDALAALAWLRTHPAIDPARIVLTASGLGGLVALHVAAIDGDVAGVVAWDGLSSFRSLLAAAQYPWPADAFLPHLLRHYDLPDLAGALPCPVRLFGLRDGQGQLACERERVQYQASPGVVVSPGAEPARIVDAITALLTEGTPT